MSKDRIIPVKADEVGGSGVEIQGGFFEEDYLSDLQYQNCGYETFDKMRRQDYQIKQALRAIMTPIQSAKYSYKSKDALDEKQIQQAKFKNDVLKKFMCKSFSESITEILSYLVFGFAVFEPTFYTRETSEYGLITTLRDFGFRKQSTIEEWTLDDNGNIISIRQRINVGDHQKDVEIPGDEVIVFSNEREGANWEGISILRSAYGPYFRKSIMLKMDLVGLEKMAIGTPVAYIDQALSNDTAELDKLKSVLQKYTKHESQFILLPESMKDKGFEIVKGEYNNTAMDGSIKREDVSILNSVLASFLAIGVLKVGGNAQNDGQMELFLNSLNHIAQYICQQIDPIIHQTYVMNFGEPEIELNLECSGISKKNLKDNADIISTLTKAGLITPDATLESHLRDRNELPLREETEEGEQDIEDKKEDDVEQEPDEDQTPDEDTEEPDEEIQNSEFKLEHRDLTDAERRVDLDEIEKDFDQSEVKYEKTIKPVLTKMRGKFLADVKSALNNKNREKSLMSINVGFTSQLQKDLKETIKGFVDKGEKQASGELNAPRDLQDDGVVKNVSTRILFQSQEISEDVARGVKKSGVNSALNALADGLDDDAIIQQVDEDLKEFADSGVPVAGKGATVNQFINTGRNNFFFRNKSLVQGFQFSAVIDTRTTHICRSLDKQTFSASDVKSFDLRPPLHWNCRSILVPILMSQPTVNLTGLKVGSVGDLSARQVLKQKQFNDPEKAKGCNHVNLHEAPVGFETERDGKKYVKDYDGKFRLK